MIFLVYLLVEALVLVIKVCIWAVIFTFELLYMGGRIVHQAWVEERAARKARA